MVSCCLPCCDRLQSHLLLRRHSTSSAGGKTEGDDEESSEDEDYLDEEEEDEGSLEGFVAEDESSEEEEEKKMPAKKSTSKTPPRKKPTPKKAPATGVDDVVDGLAAMDITSRQSYNLGMVAPYLMYSHMVDEREHLKIEYYVPALHRSSFLPRRHPSDPNKLLGGVVVPSLFADKERQNLVHHGDADFNQNTHMNTSFKKLLEQVYSDLDDGNPGGPSFLGQPIESVLPYPCEEEIDWEVQYYPIDNDDLTDDIGAEQFFAVLTVSLISIVKPKHRAAGRSRVIGGGGNNNNNKTTWTMMIDSRRTMMLSSAEQKES